MLKFQDGGHSLLLHFQPFPRLRVAPLSLSPSCVKRREDREKKISCAKSWSKKTRIPRGHFFLGVYLRPRRLEGLSKRRITWFPDSGRNSPPLLCGEGQGDRAHKTARSILPASKDHSLIVPLLAYPERERRKEHILCFYTELRLTPIAIAKWN